MTSIDISNISTTISNEISNISTNISNKISNVSTTTSNSIVSNASSTFYSKNLPIYIVAALFLLVTSYYTILLLSFKMPINKLIVSYSIIIVLLITILVISRYYFIFFGTYETFIADYKKSLKSNNNNNNNNKNKNKNKNNETLSSYSSLTLSPFAPIYDVDKMCSEATPDHIDHDDISWKCCVRDDYGHDKFSLKTSANEAGKESSAQYKLKYDGIYDIH